MQPKRGSRRRPQTRRKARTRSPGATGEPGSRQSPTRPRQSRAAPPEMPPGGRQAEPPEPDRQTPAPGPSARLSGSRHRGWPGPPLRRQGGTVRAQEPAERHLGPQDGEIGADGLPRATAELGSRQSPTRPRQSRAAPPEMPPGGKQAEPPEPDRQTPAPGPSARLSGSRHRGWPGPPLRRQGGTVRAQEPAERHLGPQDGEIGADGLPRATAELGSRQSPTRPRQSRAAPPEMPPGGKQAEPPEPDRQTPAPGPSARLSGSRHRGWPGPTRRRPDRRPPSPVRPAPPDGRPPARRRWIYFPSLPPSHACTCSAKAQKMTGDRVKYGPCINHRYNSVQMTCTFSYR